MCVRVLCVSCVFCVCKLAHGCLTSHEPPSPPGIREALALQAKEAARYKNQTAVAESEVRAGNYLLSLSTPHPIFVFVWEAADAREREREREALCISMPTCDASSYSSSFICATPLINLFLFLMVCSATTS